jgi:hypothetical protein
MFVFHNSVYKSARPSDINQIAVTRRESTRKLPRREFKWEEMPAHYVNKRCFIIIIAIQLLSSNYPDCINIMGRVGYSTRQTIGVDTCGGTNQHTPREDYLISKSASLRLRNAGLDSFPRGPAYTLLCI